MVKRVIAAILIFMAASNIQAQWIKTNLPAYANSLAVSGENLFAGTLNGGMYRSTNNGSSWTEINNGITQKQIWSTTVLGSNVFAGTSGGGIFKSVDNGNTWTLSNNGIPATAIIRSFAQFGAKLFATTNNSGIYISLDNGATWTQHNSGVTGLVAQPLLTTDTDLFVGVGARIFKYDSANSKWVLASSGIPNNTVSSITYMKTNKYLFAGISSSVNEVVRSSDKGNSWVLSDNGLPKVPVASLAAVGNNLFAGNDYGVYLSTDYGTSWVDVSTGMTGASYCTFLTPGKTDLFVVYKGDVWKRQYSGMITSVKRASSEVPSSFELKQNYPNPFNPETTINYNITKPSQVTLKVFDVIGNEVATLVDEYLQTGIYSSQFSISNSSSRSTRVGAGQLSSGVYFYTLKAGNFLSTKKMILIK